MRVGQQVAVVERENGQAIRLAFGKVLSVTDAEVMVDMGNGEIIADNPSSFTPETADEFPRLYIDWG